MSATRTALFRAVGCVVRHGGKLLLLKRAAAKSFPGRWGVPSGKLEDNETELQAVVRELFEETGILLSGDQIDLFGTYPVDTHEMAFDYSLFLHIATEMPSVKLQPNEHSDFGWFTLAEAIRLQLVPELRQMLEEVERTLTPDGQLDLLTIQPMLPRSDLRQLETAVSKCLRDSFKLRPVGPTGPWYTAIGAPGAGKTTTLCGMNEARPDLPYCYDGTILKPGSRLNTYLKEAFDHGNIAYFFHFQIEVLPLRWWQTLTAPPGALVDETIYSTLAYSRALLRLHWITEAEYQTFFHHYLRYSALLRTPKAVYFLRCNGETLKRRIRRRRRTIETHYAQAYLDMLTFCYEEIAQELRHVTEVIAIDTTRISPREVVTRYAPTS